MELLLLLGLLALGSKKATQPTSITPRTDIRSQLRSLVAKSSGLADYFVVEVDQGYEAAGSFTNPRIVLTAREWKDVESFLKTKSGDGRVKLAYNTAEYR